MDKKTSDFVCKSLLVHGDIYEYSKTLYKDSKSKVTITCKHHGDFSVRPNNHLLGVGCRSCGVIKCSSKRKKTTDSFIDRATIVHNGKYDYSSVKYEYAKKPVDIICKVHGIFNCNPNNHLNGKGCPACAIDNVKDDVNSFIEKAKNTHGTKYDYSKVVYTGSKDKVEIICKKDNKSFLQSPAMHLSGCGCPYCSGRGYDESKQGSFYVLTDNEITKIGITNRDVEQRVSQINKSGKRFSILTSYKFTSGVVAKDLEKHFLVVLRNKYKQPLERFDGWTECFMNVDLANLLVQVKQKADSLYFTEEIND